MRFHSLDYRPRGGIGIEKSFFKYQPPITLIFTEKIESVIIIKING
jgi:hypothetical protein